MASLPQYKIDVAKRIASELARWAAGSHPKTQRQKDAFGQAASYITQYVLSRYGTQLEQIAGNTIIGSSKMSVGTNSSYEEQEIKRLASEIWHGHQ